MCSFCYAMCPGHCRKFLSLQNLEGSRKNYSDPGSMGRCMHLPFSRFLPYLGAFSEGRYLEAPGTTQANVHRYFLAEEDHLSISITK